MACAGCSPPCRFPRRLRQVPDFRLRTNGWPWLGVALALKTALSLFFVRFFLPPAEGAIPGFLGVLANDTFGYIQPVEEFLRSGNPGELFGFRMLGYGLPYLLLRLFLSQPAALNGLLVAQTALAAFALYLLSLLAERIAGTSRAFILTFVAYLLVPIISFYDVVALPESFATSSLVIAVYLLVKGTRRALLVSGGCITWCVFMKPIFLPLLGLGLAHLIWVGRGRGARTVALSGALFLAPFAIADGLWIMGRVQSGATKDLALQPSLHPLFLDPDKHTEALTAFLGAMGEDWQNAGWFYSGERTPCRVVTSRFDCAAVASVQQRAQATQSNLITHRPDVDRDWAVQENRRISEELRAYAESIRHERPGHYYGVAPLVYLARFISASSTHRMFGDYTTMNPKLRPFRLAIDSLWWLLEALFAALLVLRARRVCGTPSLALLTAIVLYFYSVYTLVFRMNDFRYLVPVLPLVVVTIACLMMPGPRSRTLGSILRIQTP